MIMNIASQLKDFGLNQNETKVYLFLLEYGIATPPQIAKATGIARSNTYSILDGLKQTGLISEHRRNRRKSYLALAPESLMKTIEKKRETLESLLPDLRALYKKYENKPAIKFFEGLEEVKMIYEETLSSSELMAIGSTEKLFALDPEFFMYFERRVKKNKIVVSEIIDGKSTLKGHPQSQSVLKGLLESVALPSKYGDFSADILIWEDSIAIINLDEPIFGTVLTNASLASTFRVLFSALADLLNQ